MALLPSRVPAFPTVAAARGVPALTTPGVIARALDVVTLLVADAIAIRALFIGPQWGIFDKAGKAVLLAEAVLSVEYRREWAVADFPVQATDPNQAQAFASYDKVAEPYDLRVSFASDGRGSFFNQLTSGNALVSLVTGQDAAQTTRTAFLNELDRRGATLDLVSVVTPEKTYPSCNIVHFDYRRESRGGGVSMIVVDVWLREIRVTATATYVQTKTPAGADTQSGGARQADPPTAAQSRIIESKIPT